MQALDLHEKWQSWSPAASMISRNYGRSSRSCRNSWIKIAACRCRCMGWLERSKCWICELNSYLRWTKLCISTNRLILKPVLSYEGSSIQFPCWSTWEFYRFNMDKAKGILFRQLYKDIDIFWARGLWIRTREYECCHDSRESSPAAWQQTIKRPHQGIRANAGDPDEWVIISWVITTPSYPFFSRGQVRFGIVLWVSTLVISDRNASWWSSKMFKNESWLWFAITRQNCWLEKRRTRRRSWSRSQLYRAH